VEWGANDVDLWIKQASRVAQQPERIAASYNDSQVTRDFQVNNAEVHLNLPLK